MFKLKHNFPLKKFKFYSDIRTRFAPSPTGFMHLGALRTALYCYLFAKRNKGTFILRIEDTDQKRYVQGSVEQIKNTLEWSSVKFDEYYVQSERYDIYKKYAQTLLEKGHAYKCYCNSNRLQQIKEEGESKGSGSKYDRYCLSLSPEELKEFEDSKTPFVIRMKIPDNENIVFEDKVFGKMSVKSEHIDDQVLIKSDGFPTYHLANVVDDYEMKISHVIRGSEWISSTPKHVLLYRMFGWDAPVFAHLPLLVNEDGSKLSKRQGHSSIDWYKEKGFLPESLVNFVANLGWTSEDGDDILDLKDLIQKFSLERVHKGNCMVDLKKLEWINSQHIRRKIDNDIDSVLKSVRSKIDSKFSDEYLKSVLRTTKERIKSIDEFPNHFSYYFKDINFVSENSLKFKQKIDKVQNKEKLLSYFINLLENSQVFTQDSIHQMINKTKDDLSVNYNDLVSVLRYYSTGSQVGAPINNTIETLGKELTLKRLKSY